MSCQKESITSDQLAELLAVAESRIHGISPQGVLPRIDQWLVIDVREPAETLHGYLPFATNVPRGQLEFYFVDHPAIETSRDILLYSNTSRRSLLAAHTLAQLGFSRVSILDGGIDRWAELGLPLE